MAKILAFAGSNSSESINFKLVKYTCSLIEGHDVQVLDMANYPFPIYSADLEKKEGYSNSMVEFLDDIKKSDALILSINEYNSTVSGFFKNVLDWLSRIDRKFLQDTKIVLMAVSPGKRGGIGALEYTESILPRFGGEVVATFSFPSFSENFKEGKGIIDQDLAKAHLQALNSLTESL